MGILGFPATSILIALIYFLSVNVLNSYTAELPGSPEYSGNASPRSPPSYNTV